MGGQLVRYRNIIYFSLKPIFDLQPKSAKKGGISRGGKNILSRVHIFKKKIKYYRRTELSKGLTVDCTTIKIMGVRIKH